MENKIKGNKVLEIILIVLVALSFVLLPLLNQYRNKSISLNNTQFVHRQNISNGNVNIESELYDDVFTFSCNFTSYVDNDKEFTMGQVYGNVSITGSNDIFGLGFDNFFRFVTTSYSASGFSNVFGLEYYVRMDSSNVFHYLLGYYQITESNNILSFKIIPPLKISPKPTWNVINLSYFTSAFDTTLDTIQSSNLCSNLLSYNYGYRYSTRLINNADTNTTYFVNITQDTFSEQLASARNTGYQDGYKVGYDKGIEDANGNSVFGVLQKASASISAFLNIEVLPNLSLWLLISIPFSISLMVILLRLLRGGS